MGWTALLLLGSRLKSWVENWTCIWASCFWRQLSKGCDVKRWAALSIPQWIPPEVSQKTMHVWFWNPSGPPETSLMWEVLFFPLILYMQVVKASLEQTSTRIIQVNFQNPLSALTAMELRHSSHTSSLRCGEPPVCVWTRADSPLPLVPVAGGRKGSQKAGLAVSRFFMQVCFHGRAHSCPLDGTRTPHASFSPASLTAPSLG